MYTSKVVPGSVTTLDEKEKKQKEKDNQLKRFHQEYYQILQVPGAFLPPQHTSQQELGPPCQAHVNQIDPRFGDLTFLREQGDATA